MNDGLFWMGALIIVLALAGCTAPPVETDQPSYNRAAAEFCWRHPENVLCRQ